MNDDGIIMLNDTEPIKPFAEEIINEKKEIKEEFINGLPDWDLEPPYEVIKRSNL